MSKSPGKPEKINIDHILEDDSAAASQEEEGIEIVSGGPEEPEAAPPAGETGGAGGSPVEAPAAAEELARARKEIEDVRDSYVRVRADFENFRKRVERDRAEDRLRITATLVTEILPAIDSLDRALGRPDDDPGFREGVALIRRQIDESFRKLGLEPIDAIGEPFDPVYHEAMTAEPREGFAPNTVIEEIRKGYTLGGRVIRPTLVKVALPPPEAAAESPGESGETDGQDHRD
ncbi:MAG TPA: nucleotide exchange factor GrpE [Candidatus Saccharimonadales bacterium]|nr:nucleotide exchange factor GrpE [Candidatus Saccharimonadales bacterium]